jgi:putative endopeptidase
MFSTRSLRVVLITLALLLPLHGIALPVLAQTTPIATPVAASVHGIDLADMDLAVSPRDDFYRFANGGWLDRAVIPADRSGYDVFVELTDRTIAQQLSLLRAAVGPDGAVPGSDEAKAGTIFAQGMDMAMRNEQGIAPIQDAIDRIAAIDSLAAYHTYLERSAFDGARATLGLHVFPSFTDSSINSVYLGGPMLGLPNRDYYLDDDPALAAIRQAYVDNSAALLEAVGYDAGEAATAAQAVYDFEKALAATTLTREQEQDFSLQNNPMTLAKLADVYPEMDWTSYLAALDITGVDTIIVVDKGYLAALPTIMADTPVSTLRAYLLRGLIVTWADTLNDELEETAFAFDQVLSGIEEQPKLEERVLDQVNNALPDAVGKLYVAAYFPPEAKAAIEQLTQDVLTAFGERLDANTWMTPETNAEALAKLQAVTIKVGYPDKWQTYEAVEPADSFAGSLRSAREASLRRDYAKAGKPVDRGEWEDPAQIVNAYYNPFGNEIVFPAGILQPPFFDYQADAASNYGAIGFVIGHEITHGFDLQGSQFDAQGNLNDWWTDVDRARFLALNDALAAQYSAIEVAPGLFINGKITVTENAADLGGIQNAYAALQNRLAGEGEAPAATPIATPVAVTVEPPFTPEQRFFIAAATVWRSKVRPERLDTLVRSDQHAPGSVRATEPLRNADPFFTAFGIQPGDPMWLAPAERIVIW